jgi:hypothetical protein
MFMVYCDKSLELKVTYVEKVENCEFNDLLQYHINMLALEDKVAINYCENDVASSMATRIGDAERTLLVNRAFSQAFGMDMPSAVRVRLVNKGWQGIMVHFHDIDGESIDITHEKKESFMTNLYSLNFKYPDDGNFFIIEALIKMLAP